MGQQAYRLRLPEQGAYWVITCLDGGTLVLNATLYEGEVKDGEALEVVLKGTELDLICEGDQLAAYHRRWEGDPRTWFGRHVPGDEKSDPESMNNWKVWLRIEEG